MEENNSEQVNQSQSFRIKQQALVFWQNWT